ncbi:hypothetical protein DLM76_09405 [Leptospira yasudae]|nr:hypothetical protein DLM76_09405 [Leptospira yasudae]
MKESITFIAISLVIFSESYHNEVGKNFPKRIDDRSDRLCISKKTDAFWEGDRLRLDSENRS